MSRTVVIHQPDFAPYLGFFHRFLSADCFIALDHVQFVQHTGRAWTHRDKIKTPQREKWLTLSVQKAPRDTPINEVLLSEATDWRGANLRQLEENYRKALFFKDIFPKIERLYRAPDTHLATFNQNFIEWLMDAFDVRLPLVRSSTLDPVGSKSELLVDILQKVGATHYLSGVGARDYMDVATFAAAGIEVTWQNFVHPVYTQLHGEFIPYLSSLDVLLNCGYENARKILRSTQ
jgi:hypothetical protein